MEPVYVVPAVIIFFIFLGVYDGYRRAKKDM